MRRQCHTHRAVLAAGVAIAELSDTRFTTYQEHEMRILHTSDWHLGRSFGPVSLAAHSDIARRDRHPFAIGTNALVQVRGNARRIRRARRPLCRRVRPGPQCRPDHR